MLRRATYAAIIIDYFHYFDVFDDGDAAFAVVCEMLPCRPR